MMVSRLTRLSLLFLLTLSFQAFSQESEKQSSTHKFQRASEIYAQWISEKTAIGEIKVKSEPRMLAIDSAMSIGETKKAKALWLSMVSEERTKLAQELGINIDELGEFLQYFHKKQG